MTACTTESSPPVSIAICVDRLLRCDGPPDRILSDLLTTACQVGPAEAGAILHPGPTGCVQVRAAYPPLTSADQAPGWLHQAGRSMPGVIAAGRTLVEPIATESVAPPWTKRLVLIPVQNLPESTGGLNGVAAFSIRAADPADVRACRERLELTTDLLRIYALKLTLDSRELDLQRLQTVIKTVAAAGEHAHFTAAAMGLCNEVAARWRCERVALGFLSGQHVQLRTMSHAAKFSRKTQVVRDIESAMEECLDQDEEIIYPEADDSTVVTRATATLSRRHGPSAICCLPLRDGAKVIGVLVTERSPAEPLLPVEVETLRLVCDLSTPRLANLHDQDRWFGAKCASAAQRFLAGVVGSEHTWTKVVAVVALGVVLVLTFAKTDYRPEAPFIFQATRQQIIVAPFDGYLRTAPATIGDQVEANTTVLATLETSELELELAAARADQAAYLKQESVSQRDGNTAGAQMAKAQGDKVAASIDLLEYQLRQATITSSMSGIVVTGDLERQLGAPVRVGDVLFEVAQLDSIRAELALPEDQVPDITPGLTGELATASYPGIKVPVIVERIDPVAEVVNQRNVFKIRVRLLETRAWMRPGMEGIARISAGQRSLGWIWTRRFVNWVRMQLWM